MARTGSKSPPLGSSKSPTGTQAIDRALDVLSSFVEHPSQGISDIAAVTDLSPSTAHRIVRALVTANFLEQDADTDQYRFGHAALVLGQRARESLGFDVAVPFLEQLGGETGESVNMGILDDGQVVVVLRVESVQPLRFDQPVGSRISPHCSSMGKSMLAYSDAAWPSKLERITSTTITTKKGLGAELVATRDRGFAFDFEESIPGVSCVGAPVLDNEGQAIAAVAIQGPTVRMTPERLQHLSRRLVETTQSISQAMHYRPGTDQ